MVSIKRSARALFDRLRNNRAAKLLGLVLFLVVALSWVFDSFIRQQELLILETSSSSGSSGSILQFKDCSDLEKSWGTSVTSHGIKESSTYMFELNEFDTKSYVKHYVLKPNCKAEPSRLKSIYVKSELLPQFAKLAESLTFRFVLVSGDSDLTIPEDIQGGVLDLYSDNFKKILDSSFLVKWYVQNLNVRLNVKLDGGDYDLSTHKNKNDLNPPAMSASRARARARALLGAPIESPMILKLMHLPIGLDFHTLAEKPQVVTWGQQMSALDQQAVLDKTVAAAPPLKERALKVYSTYIFNVHRTIRSFSDRREAQKALPSSLVSSPPDKISRIDSWTRASQTAFVASPHGNGMDCHRTWEALALGSIPVVKKSDLDEVYSGLPVLIVDSWSDVSDSILKASLDEIVAKKAKGELSLDRVALSWWRNEIGGWYYDNTGAHHY